MAEQKTGWRLQGVKVNRRLVRKHARRAEKASIKHAHRFVVRRWHRAIEVRRHIALWMAAIGFLVATVIVQAYLSDATILSQQPSAGGTYAEGMVGTVSTLNPLYVSTAPELAASRLLFSSLLAYDTDGSLVPDAAESISTQQEGRRYTVLLRDNIRWHDSRKLTADDVMFTIGLIRNELVGSPLAPQWRGITIRKLDERRIQFTLPSVYAAFPHALTFPIVPKHILENIQPGQLRQSGFSVYPIGSGPFSFSLLQREHGIATVNMKRFTGYYAGAPKLDRFELYAYEDVDALTNAMSTGRLSAAVNIDTPKGKFLQYKAPTSSVAYAFFNTAAGPVKDQKVRSALQRAVDRNALAERLGYTTEGIAGPFIRSQVPGLKVPAAPFSPQSAVKLLAQAGWKHTQDGTLRDKRGQQLTLRLITIRQSNYEAIAASLKQAWEKIGALVELNVVDPAKNDIDFQSAILQPRAYDVLIYEVELGADPDVYAFWHSTQAAATGLNLSNLQNELLDDILSSARTTVNDTLRAKKYTSFAQQWAAQVPAIPLYQAQLRYTVRKNVNSVSDTALYVTPYARYGNVINWRVERSTVYKTP